MSDEPSRLHAFILRLANRLFLAAEVLSIRAERRAEKVKDDGYFWAS